jgi:hypothetical protein
MRLISVKSAGAVPSMLLLVFPSCRSVIHLGVPGAEYAIIQVRDGQPQTVEKKRVSVYQPPNPRPPKPPSAVAPDRTHPLIDQWIKAQSMPGQQRVDVLVALLPPLQAGDNQAFMSSFQGILEAAGGEQIMRHDSAYTFSLSLPMSALRGLLLKEPALRYIEPVRIPLRDDLIPGFCKKTAGTTPTSAPADQRIVYLAKAINLDKFASPATVSVALLDSGVSTHSLLPAAQIAGLDCLTVSCAAGDPTDGCLNHGTPDTGILIATGTGTSPIGVLPGAGIKSFKVVAQSGSCTAEGNADAVRRAFDEKITGSMLPVDVVLTEVLLDGDVNSAASLAADRAYDAGYPVIVATNPVAMVAPGNAHKVFPVSATNQGETKTSDGRKIPAVWAYTFSETTSNDSKYCVHDGASGAAPYAVAVAAKVKQILSSRSLPSDPGNIYAMMLALARLNVKARTLYLPETGNYTTGSFDISHATETYATVTVPSGKLLRAAIWWPESAVLPSGSSYHNRIYLEIVKPSGFSAKKAEDQGSVFQYASVPLTIESGNYIIKVKGANVVSGPQKVYWAAFSTF